MLELAGWQRFGRSSAGGVVAEMPARTRIVTIAYSALLVAALLLVGRSLRLIYGMARPIPYWDAWEFMRDLPAITSGHYTLADLFRFHNEHRIVTTRLLMLLDLRFFDQSGYLPTMVFGLLLCCLGGSLGIVAAGRTYIGVVVAAITASLLLSVVQWENYASGFQVQFGLVDGFAVASVGLFILSARAPRFAWPLLGAAVAADALSIASMASGNAVVVPLVLVGLVLRMPIGRIVAVSAAAMALSVAYMVHFPPAPVPPSHDAIGILQFAVNYLGATLRGYPEAPYGLGLALLGAYAIHAVLILRSFWARRAVDPVAVWLAAIGLFILCGALVTAAGRLPYGPETATSSRYAIQSLLFSCCVFLLTWRSIAAWQRNTEAGIALSAITLVLSAGSTLPTQPLAEWSARVADYDAAGTALATGVLSDGALANVYPVPDRIQDSVRFMAAHRLGPFSGRYAAYYRPPTNTVGSIERPLPGCIGIADSVKAVGPHWLQVKGWAVDGAHPGQDGWVMIYDGGRRLLGFGRQADARPDAAASVPVAPTRLGYRVMIDMSGADRAAMGDAFLVLVPSSSAGDACRFPLSLDGMG